jgi:hypothetical protein
VISRETVKAGGDHKSKSKPQPCGFEKEIAALQSLYHLMILGQDAIHRWHVP